MHDTNCFFITLLQGNRQRRHQQRQGLGASVLPIILPPITRAVTAPAASERPTEDANLLSTTSPPPPCNLTHGVLSERNHLGGRETGTVAMAAARQEQAEIQRRHGDDRSLVARHEIFQDAEEGPPQGPLLPVNPALPENQPQLPRRGRPPKLRGPPTESENLTIPRRGRPPLPRRKVGRPHKIIPTTTELR